MLGRAAAEDDGDPGLAAGQARGCPCHRHDPIHLGRACCDALTTRTAQARHRSPSRPDAGRTKAGPTTAAERADHHGLDLRRGWRAGVRPLRQPDLDGLRGRARRARGRALPRLRLGPRRGGDRARPRRRRTRKVVVPRHAYTGTIMQLGDLEARGRAAAPTSSTSPTPTRSSPPATDAALVWLESPTNPALEVADIAGDHRSSRTRPGAYVVVDNTFATPLLQRPLEHGVDLVVHSATKYLAGHSDVLMGAIVTRDDELLDVLKGRRDLARRGARARSRRGWRSAACARCTCASSGPRPTPQELVAGSREHPALAEVRYPGFGGIVSHRARPGRAGRGPARRARPACGCTPPRWAGSSRRWSAAAAGRPRPPTIPEGLVRLSVGIEDVEDLWRTSSAALDDARLRFPRPPAGPQLGCRSGSVQLGLGVARDEGVHHVQRGASGRRRRRRRARRSGRRRRARPASASSDEQDFAPSATCRVEAKISSVVIPWPSRSPNVRLRESGEEQVATRSPRPASPIRVSGLAPMRGGQAGGLGEAAGDHRGGGVVAEAETDGHPDAKPTTFL